MSLSIVACSQHHDKFVVLLDSNLVPDLKPGKRCSVNGWMVQQVIAQGPVSKLELLRDLQVVKLAVARVVPTRRYVTLDADIMCTRLTNFSALVPRQGRALLDFGPMSLHRDWWNGSAALLHVRVEVRTASLGRPVAVACASCVSGVPCALRFVSIACRERVRTLHGARTPAAWRCR